MKSQTITLCGSARFEKHFHAWNKILTLSGHTVFSLGCFPSVEGDKDWYTDAQKALLDQVHKVKILRSDAILVLNVGGYIGNSTFSEMQFAKLLDKEIYAIASRNDFKSASKLVLNNKLLALAPERKS